MAAPAAMAAAREPSAWNRNLRPSARISRRSCSPWSIGPLQICNRSHQHRWIVAEEADALIVRIAQDAADGSRLFVMVYIKRSPSWPCSANGTHTSLLRPGAQHNHHATEHKHPQIISAPPFRVGLI